MKSFQRTLIGFLLFTVAGCAHPPRRIHLEAEELSIHWTSEEKAAPLAVKNLKATQEVSIHWIRLRTAEKPHRHTKHDLTVVMMRGEAEVYLEGHKEKMLPGDLVEIPRGMLHWAKNTDSSASEVYAIFSPPYDGKDYHEEKDCR